MDEKIPMQWENMQTPQKSQQLGLRPNTLVLQGNHAKTVPPYSLYLKLYLKIFLCVA